MPLLCNRVPGDSSVCAHSKVNTNQDFQLMRGIGGVGVGVFVCVCVRGGGRDHAQKNDNESNESINKRETSMNEFKSVYF